MRFRKGQAVKHKGWLRGIALRVVDGAMKKVPVIAFVDDYEGCPREVETGEYEEEDDLGKVIVHMVGDDVRFTVDENDLEELADTDFCSECGQMGCAHSIATE